MTNAIQAIKTTGSNAVNKVKNMSTKKKVATAAATAAIIGSIALAYSKGKAANADIFAPLEKPGFKTNLRLTKKGFQKIGNEIAQKAIVAKNAIVNFFSNIGSKKD